MRVVPLALSLAVGFSLLAQAAPAQTRPIRFGVQGDLGTNNVGPGVGVRVVYTALGTVLKVPGLQAYGSFDYFFPGSSFGPDGKFWEINANATWDIPNMTGFAPYLGAGLNYAHSSFNCDPYNCSGSNTGLNVLGGARFNVTPNLNVYGEVRAELRTSSAVVFTVGLLF